MTQTGKRSLPSLFTKGGATGSINRGLAAVGEEPINGRDEARIAAVALDARTTETLAGASSGLVAFAAVGFAALGIVDAKMWQALLFLVVAMACVIYSAYLCRDAGISAARQAVTNHRQAIKLATLSAPVVTSQTPKSVTKATRSAGIFLAVAGTVLLTAAARRRRS